MKKINTVLIMLCLFLFYGGLTAHASTTSVTVTESGLSEADSAATVVDWSSPVGTEPAASSGAPSVATEYAVPAQGATIPAQTGIYPQNVETLTENGILLVKKTYILDPDMDPEMLVQAFEQSGFSFTRREILRQDLPGETLTRRASKIAVADTENDDRAAILAQFPSYINHSEEGYTGQLMLDAASLVTEPGEFEAYTYQYTKTKALTPLERNDPAYLDKEINGMTLTDISFSGQREVSVGNSLIPTSYSAVAKYTGTATGKRAVSYVSTAAYAGELTKTMPGKVLYTVIYEGAEIPAPVTIPVSADILPEPAVVQPDISDTPGTADMAASPVARTQTDTAYPLTVPLFGVTFAGVLTLFCINTINERKARKENRETLEEIARFIRGETQ
ncbi:hypothetical protein FACS1894191_4550 [Clostridia bacterium]|nr:hypothetical protein FACS1894191_4550 [Clostridia bacterium]